MVDYNNEGFRNLEKALMDVNIALYEENGEIRDYFSVINELAEIWEPLTPEQKNYITTRFENLKLYE